MSGTDHNAPTGKSGERNRKKEQKNKKPGQQMSPQPDQLQRPQPEPPQAAEQPAEATIAPPDPASTEAAASVDADRIGADELPAAVPVSFQTIVNAYGDFTRKSLEETRSFVEKLTGARSLDKAMELQTEFARQAFKTFVTESQKIRELHSELAKQTFKPLEGRVSNASRDTV